MERIRLLNNSPSSTFWFVCSTAGYCRQSYIHVGRRYAVIIGPGPHWFHELQRSWFEQWLQIHMITRCSAHCTYRTLCVLCCSFCFLLNFLWIVLSNAGDRELWVRVIIAAAVRLWCLLVTSWPPLCGWWVPSPSIWNFGPMWPTTFKNGNFQTPVDTCSLHLCRNT